jgi:hypothetical protein
VSSEANKSYTEDCPPPALDFTKPFLEKADARLIGEFIERFDSVARHFPEVKGEIKVGITTSYNGLALIAVRGGATVDKICFPPLRKKGLPSRYVIGHELMHLVQSKDGSIPFTERSCDIFTLARLPAELLDHPPIYLRMPRKVRELWSDPAVHAELAEAAHLLAIEAIITRKENSRYLSWWEKRFSEKSERITAGR